MLTESQLVVIDWLMRSKNFSAAAPIIAGIDIRNDMRAASVREKPINSAAVIVTPLREVPGINAKHWETPIKIALLGVKICDVSRFT